MTDTFKKEYSDNEKLKLMQFDIKNAAEHLEQIFKDIGQSREMSLAMTNLEQAVMWAVKGLYRND